MDAEQRDGAGLAHPPQPLEDAGGAQAEGLAGQGFGEDDLAGLGAVRLAGRDLPFGLVPAVGRDDAAVLENAEDAGRGRAADALDRGAVVLAAAGGLEPGKDPLARGQGRLAGAVPGACRSAASRPGPVSSRAGGPAGRHPGRCRRPRPPPCRAGGRGRPSPCRPAGMAEPSCFSAFSNSRRAGRWSVVRPKWRLISVLPTLPGAARMKRRRSSFEGSGRGSAAVPRSGPAGRRATSGLALGRRRGWPCAAAGALAAALARRGLLRGGRLGGRLLGSRCLHRRRLRSGRLPHRAGLGSSSAVGAIGLALAGAFAAWPSPCPSRP